MTGTSNTQPIRQASSRAAARIVVTYAVFALLWILVSDQALMLVFDDPATLVQASIIKGWAFVLVTAALLYFLVSRLVYRIELAAEKDRINRRRKAAQFRAHSEQVHAQLEQRVAARTVELTAANRELDAFAYAVSHDLRAPLRAMSGFSEALIEDHADQLHDEARQYLDQIILASRRMNELIDGILVLSRSTRGTLECRDINLSELAERQIERLRKSDPERRVAVEIEPDLVMHADPATIEVALNNLLENAWKYTRRTDNPRIQVKPTALGSDPAICIEDNGAGFDMAHADKLFKAFQRLHRQDEFPGTGIGLATVERIIHRHGGQIEASANPGKGARFVFSLPANQAKKDPE
ncbi:MAG: GHKL domain-containing protein [Wenzhouxiangella sp.]|nr:MAG: GHKL domain-containing protein [Wenzhouxiangella sp.]